MSRARPRISIGLPVYNGERYLALAIDSVLGQTFEDFELIISDNASTDATERICKAYAARDHRIRYLRHPTNVGVTRNFNGVVDHATAPYFKWSSADDLIAPDLLERCAEVLDRDRSVVLVHSRTRFIDSTGEFVSREDPGLCLMNDRPIQRLRDLWETLRFCNAQYGVMRLDALRQTPLFGSFIGSDLCFLAELCLHGKFFELPEPRLFRRLHEHAASSLTPEQLVDHYGLERGRLILYFWSHLREHTALVFRAPIAWREKIQALRLIAIRALQQRRELSDEIGFLLRHLAGRPYPVLGAGRRPGTGPGT